MDFPNKWRDGVDPFSLKFNNFTLKEVLGYPHAGNDVFYGKGLYLGKEVEVIIKVNRQPGADVFNEVETLKKIKLDKTPVIIDHDNECTYRVSLLLEGEKLSVILKDNKDHESLEYMEEYGSMLGVIHSIRGDFPCVKDRKFFHIMDKEKLDKIGLSSLYQYLVENEPKTKDVCFCHGDFHYANVLWKDHHISGILDFELSGMGIREFDIAWAIINRPGQTFLNTLEEIELFLKGYRKHANYNYDYVIYYMALVYSWFIFFGDDNYHEYVKGFLRKINAI